MERQMERINEKEEKARVTATRRRPQRFEDLIGQDFVVATLQSSIDKQKVAHAYLFSGPRGCGKTSSARILAKALNCQKGMNRTPCGECESCRAITKGSSLDVIEIDGASNTSVNDVRQIKDEVLFPPNSSRYKIYIIDEVHMLSTSAFNALLKTIEEPPPYIVFIFATTELHKVPATIKSRCQQFNFRLVSLEDLKNTLAKACAELEIKAEDEALYWIAKEATGSVRDAYTLFDQVEAFSDGNITMQKIQEKLGLTSLEAITSIFSACANGNVKDAITAFNHILQNGVSIEQFLIDSANYLRSILLLEAGIEKESLLGYSKERLASDVLEKWESTQVEMSFSLILQLYKDVRFSLDPSFEVELALCRMATLKDYVSPKDLKTAFMAAKSLLENTKGVEYFASPKSFNTASTEKKNTNLETSYRQTSERAIFSNSTNEEPSQSKEADHIKVNSIEKLREVVIAHCEKENGLLSLTLSQTDYWEEIGDKLIIYGKSSFDVSMLKNNLATIAQSVHRYYEKELKIEILKEQPKNEQITNQNSRSIGNTSFELPKEGQNQTEGVQIQIDPSKESGEIQALKNVFSERDFSDSLEDEKGTLPITARLIIKMFEGELVETSQKVGI